MEIKITKLNEITEPDKKINVRVKVETEEISPHLSIHQKCVVSDRSNAQVEAVVWEKSFAAGIPELEEDAWYELRDVYTKEFNGAFSISITSYSKVTRLEDKPGQTTLV